MTDSPRPIISAEKLTKAYGLMPVLRGFNLEIQRGEFVALLGANGSGKSTFLRMLTGLTRPTSGHLSVGGWSMPEEAHAIRGVLGLVSHRSLVYENLTARENLRFFGKLYNLPKEVLEARITTLLSEVGLLKRGDSLTRTFSRGMLQRLSIARALIHQPDVLLLDEPYTGLDQSAGQMLDGLLADAHGKGHTVVMVTHHIEHSVTLANRAVVIARGVVAHDAPTAGVTGSQLAQIFRDVTGMIDAK